MQGLDAALRTLKRDRSNAWDGRAAGGAPHKPLLLLALCDLAELGSLSAAFVPFDGSAFEVLGRSFQAYWRVLFPDTAGTLWMPLWHLSSDGFWFPQAREGARELQRSPGGMRRLRERCSGARIDAELFRRLIDPLERQSLRALVLGHYFDESTRAALAERVVIQLEAASYATRLELLARVDPLLQIAESAALSSVEREPVRTQGFRIAVVGAYDHRCAACGLRLQTPDGLTAVQAAHIHPWSISHDDRIQNGLALCPTCHWTFDRFLWTTRAPVRIRVSRVARWDRNLPGTLEALDGRDLIVPDDTALLPDPASLAWHRKQAS